MTDEAFQIIGSECPNPWLIACDHASNRVPDMVCSGNLGLDPTEMSRHIAWDVGAEGVTRRLVERMGAAGILGRFSRLVIDPNRGEDDPTLIMQVYDGTIIEGNRGLAPEAREHRLNAYYRPYHAAYAELAAMRRDTIIVAVHSFTPNVPHKAAHAYWQTFWK